MKKYYKVIFMKGDDEYFAEHVIDEIMKSQNAFIKIGNDLVINKSSIAKVEYDKAKTKEMFLKEVKEIYPEPIDPLLRQEWVQKVKSEYGEFNL